MWEHKSILQIMGIKSHPCWLAGLLHDMKNFGYKLICRCDRCIVFEEVVNHSRSYLMPEPMTEGVLKTFDILHSWGHKWKSSSAVQNWDGSTTTSWIVYKEYGGQR